MITLPRNPLKPGERPDPATRSRRRFARRQWLRRWLVWRYVIASFLLVALVVGVDLAGLHQLVPHRPAGEGGGRVAAQRAADPRGRPGARPAPTSSSSTSGDPVPGRRPGARTPGRRLARLAARRPDQGHRAHARRRGRDRRPLPRHGRRRRLFRDYPRPPVGMPRVCRPPTRAAPRSPRPPGSSRRCPPAWPRGSTMSRWPASTRSR